MELSAAGVGNALVDFDDFDFVLDSSSTCPFHQRMCLVHL